MASTAVVYNLIAKDRASNTFRKVGSQADTMTTKIGKAGKSMSRVGAKMTKSVTLPIAAVGFMALKASGTFEKSMNKVSAVSGATGKDFEKLRNQAKELGRTTQFSASEAADGMSFLAMAGFKTKDILDAMPATLSLAAAGNMDLATTADIASNVLTGYGMEANKLGHAADVMAKTFTSTNTDLTQLGEAFSYVAPVAKGAGLSFEQTSAALGMLGNAGIQGSQAGTTLRGAISKLLNPTKQASQALSKLGISALDSKGNLKPLDNIIQQLDKSGATTADMMKIFGQRAGPGMSALVSQGADSLRKLTGELEKSGGTAGKIADKQMEGLNGQLKKLSSAWEGLMIEIGDSGALDTVTGILEKVTAGLSKMAKASPKTIKLVVTLSVALAALGPILWLVGKAMQAYAGIAALFAAAQRLATAASLGTRIQLAALKVQTVVSSAATAASSVVTGAWTATQRLARSAAIGTRIQLVGLRVQTIAATVAQKAASVATKAWTVAQRALNLVLRANPIGIVITILAALAVALVTAYKKSSKFRAIVQGAWAGIRKAASVAWNYGIKPVLSALKSGFHAAGTAVSRAKNAISKAWKGIESAAKKPVTFVVNSVINPLIGGINKILPKKWELPTIKGFSTGGYTGHLPISRVAGAVHGDEHVIQSTSRRKFESRNPGALDYLNKTGQLPGYKGGGRVWPVPGQRNQHTSGYPWARWAGDMPVPMGTPVRAYADGVVSMVKRLTTSYGKHIRINHGNMNTLYAHLSKILVHQGQKVKAGQVIGRSGSTGNSTGPHTHFEIAGGSGPIGAGSKGGGGPSLLSQIKSFFTDKMPAFISKASSHGGMFGGGLGGLVKSIGPRMLEKITAVLKVAKTGARAGIKHFLGFDQGGLATSAGYLPKRTVQPERVLSPQQTKAFEKAMSGDFGGKGSKYEVNVTMPETSGPKQVADEILFALRRAENGGKYAHA